MKSKLVLFSLCLLGFMIGTGWTDTIYLISGEQLIGTIIREDDLTIVIDVSGVQLSVRRSDITDIIRSSVPGPTYPSPGGASEGIRPATGSLTTPTGPTGSTTQPFLYGSNQLEEQPLQPLLPVILPKGKIYQVTGAGVRFREGPSLDYPIINTLPGKTILIELEVIEGWLRAKTTDGVEGWIHPNFVVPMENVPCLVTGDGLQIREAPGELYRALERLKRGDLVLKLEERGDWWMVLFGESIAGWCSKEYLQPLGDESQYKTKLSVISNQEAGMPVLMQRQMDQPGMQRITCTVRDPNIVIGGKTKVLIFHRDQTLFNNPELKYVSEDIVSKERLANSLAILQAGLPEHIAVTFIGVDVITILGQRIPDGSGWLYELVVPETDTLAFGFVVQNGPARGTMVLIQ